MAILSHIKDINVHVYELSSSSFASIGRTRFRRISAFDHAVEPEKKKTIKVLYGGRNHYGTTTIYSM